MKTRFASLTFALCGVMLFAVAPTHARADMIELINGDHYRGQVVSMNRSNIEFLSEIQGMVKLPRDKVAQITLHDVVPRAVAPRSNGYSAAPLILSGSSVVSSPTPGPSAGVAANNTNSLVSQMQHQGVDPKIVSQIQEQVLSKGSPEAAQQFNQMMAGLMSGSISVQDIRKQAQTAISQIQSAQKEMGGDAGGMLDGYLDILQKFVNESASDNTITGVTPGTATK